MKKSKKIIILGGIAILVIGGIAFSLTKKPKEVSTTITNVKAERGTIINTISGSGTVQPIEQYEIASTVRGDILKDNVTLGETVVEGDFLYEIDSSDAETSIRKAEIALEKQQLSYNQTMESIENLIVKSDVAGIVTNVYVDVDDNINNNGKILDITNFDELLVDLPFNTSDAKNLFVGQEVNVHIEATGESTIGKIEKIASGSYAKSTGAIVSDVQVSFRNPGSLLADEVVTVTAGNIACNDSGKVYYKTSKSIVAKTSGTIDKLNFDVGDRIEIGEVIAQIYNESSNVNAQSSLLSLEDSKLALADSKDSLNDYYITSPINGTVIAKYYKAGETLDDNKTTLAVIADMSKLSFSMSIDELDIKNISVGQEVIVTADALTNKSFKGTITEVSVLGSSMSGVTTYPVTVVIEEYEGLLPGMNVTAEIVLEEASNVVKIPVAAVSRGNVVLVKEEFANSLAVNVNADSETENTENKRPGRMEQKAGQIVEMPNTPEGYKYIKITTGLSDEDYIEVKEGLSEGDEVGVVTIKAESTTQSSNTAGMPMGMMGGGMPTGGMPTGMPSGMNNRGNGGMQRGNR